MTRFQEIISRNQAARSTRRKTVNAVMLTITGLMTLLALIPMVLFLVRRKFHAIIGLSLALTAISGAVGLWTGVHLSSE